MLVESSPLDDIRFELDVYFGMGNEFEGKSFQNNRGGDAMRKEIIELAADF